MSKIRRLGKAITSEDWLRYRPYGNMNPYDHFYLGVANDVFVAVNSEKRDFRGIFQRDDLKELAVLLTCHYEDFLNEIGLWEALRSSNQELYGYPVPFYELEEYDPEYLNWQDLAYLIWHHLGKMSGKHLHPYAPAILDLAVFCLEYFEDHLEEALVTDFFEEQLQISAELDFFELKNRLIWITFQNYLTGPEFSKVMEELAIKTMSSENEKLHHFDPGMLLYGLQDDFLYGRRSSWSALRSVDLLAAVAHGPEELREEIRGLTRRVTGTFIYERTDERFYHFRYGPTGRTFEIRRDSIDLEEKELEPGSDVGFFSIVPWRGEWWLSGSYMSWRLTPEQIEKQVGGELGSSSFYGWPEEEQLRLKELTAEREAAFVENFGSHLKVFSNMADLQEGLMKHSLQYNENLGLDDPDFAEKLEEARLQMSTVLEGQVQAGWNPHSPVAAYYAPGQGLEISNFIPELIDRLQADSLSRENLMELYGSFFAECSPELARMLVEQYSFRNLRFPLIDDPDFVKTFFEFFLRYYRPEGFKEPVPAMSFRR